MRNYYRSFILLTTSLSLTFILGGVLLAWLDSGPVQAAHQVDPAELSSLKFPNTRRAQLPDVQLSNNPLVASGFSNPIQVTHAGDGSQRLFVVEIAGRVKIVKNGTVLSTPFLDLTDRVQCCNQNDYEGLQTIVFPPDYTTKGHFYVFYIDTPNQIAVSRFNVTANPDIADPNSEEVILRIDVTKVSTFKHKGGQLAFGPLDGYLYITTGDGADTPKAQQFNSLLGKILRLDVETGNPLTYTIPASNPYTQTAGYRGEIWASGLRNPWRMSFDRLTGDYYVADVGKDAQEEISYQAAGTPGGLNFGWGCREGLLAGPITGAPCNNPTYLAGLTNPIVTYGRTDGVVTSGGFIYRGSQYPNMVGRFFYADFNFRKIWSVYKNGASWSTPELELTTTYAGLIIGEGEDGELYTLGHYNGQLRRLTDANGPAPNLASSQKSASTPHADQGEVVTYTLQLKNTGGLSSQTAFLTDVIPSGLNYIPGSLAATSGTVNASQSPTLKWQGSLSPTKNITITYRVTVGASSGNLVNQAVIDGAAIDPITLSHIIAIPRPVISSTLLDFFLPGTQPGITDAIPPPSSCDSCHTAPIYDAWRGSMMSQAGRDPLMWSALAIANNDVPNAGDYCLRCHTPKGWFEGRSHPATGSGLDAGDIEAGVACEVCHRMVDPKPSSNDEAVGIDAGIRTALTTTVPITNIGNGMMILDPLDRRRGPFSLNPQPPHGAYRTDFLSQSRDAETESRLCGTCHNVSNPALSWDEARQQYWPNETGFAAPEADVNNGLLFPIERTYDEWLNSAYAATGVYAPQFAGAKPNGMVASCQDCHMTRSTGKAAGDDIAVHRDCQTNGTGCLPEHIFVGGNTWVPQILQDTRWRLNSSDEAVYLNETIIQAEAMLKKAATLSVTLVTSGSNKTALVRVINESGHKLPTGYPEGRRMWLNLKAYNAQGQQIYESGAYDPATAILTKDSAIKIYETKLGLTEEFAQLVNLPAGESFHFVLNNTILKDNRIPPRGYSQSAFNKPGLRPVGATYQNGQYWDDTSYNVPPQTERVVATLYYQTSSKEYIDFLREKGGPDGESLGQLWDSSKSPPEPMATASASIAGPDPNLSTSQKLASTSHANQSEVVTYTIYIKNTGGLSSQTAFLTDVIPSGLNYVPGSLAASSGTVNASQSPILKWQGPLSPTKNITLTYRVTVVTPTGHLVNEALLDGPNIEPIRLSESIVIPRPAEGSEPNLFTSQKSASTSHANQGEIITYTIQIKNTGELSSQTAYLTDVIPSGLSYNPGSLVASNGTVNASQSPVLKWQGALSPTKIITLTYQVTVVTPKGNLINQAQLAAPASQPFTLTKTVVVPRPAIKTKFFLPIIFKGK